MKADDLRKIHEDLIKRRLIYPFPDYFYYGPVQEGWPKMTEKEMIGGISMSSKAGEEIFINGIETQILKVIGAGNPFIKEKEVVEILEALLKKLKEKL